MIRRQETALNPRFGEILRRERALSERSLTYVEKEIVPAAQEFLDYCVAESPHITNISERALLRGLLAYWWPVAYPHELRPLRLGNPAEYTFRTGEELANPEAVNVEGLYADVV